MAHPLILLVMPQYVYGKLPQQDIDLEVLLGHLRNSGLSVQAVDAQRSILDFKAMIEFIQKAQARIVYWNLRRRADFKAAESMIPLAKQSSPRVLMIAGGDFATRYDLAILDRIRDLDGVVRGEVELSLEALGRRVLKGEEWRNEPGISARAGSIIRNPPRRLMENLDILSAAPDDLFEAGRLECGQQVLFSRGCNSDCSYCGLQTPYRTEYIHRTKFWRCRSGASIVDEIEYYHRHRNVGRFVFNSFVVLGYEEAEQVTEVAREILRRRLVITFSFVTHPGHLCRNKAILPLLKEAGLEKLTLGIDTSLARALKLYRLEFSRADILTALGLVQEQNIKFVPSFIFYDPFLTVEEIYENLDFFEAIEPFFSHLEIPFGKIVDRHLINTVLRVRTETPMYAHLVEQGLADETDALQGDPIVRFKFPAVGKIHKIHQLANRVVGKGIRPILDSPGAAGRFPYINHLPIEFLREIASIVERQPHLDEATIASMTSEWLCRKLRPDIEKIFSVL